MLKRVLTVAHVRSSPAGVEVMFCESARIYSLSPADQARLVEALQQAERGRRAVTVWLKDLDSDEILDVEP